MSFSKQKKEQTIEELLLNSKPSSPIKVRDLRSVSILDVSYNIHRETLRGPANIMIVPEKLTPKLFPYLNLRLADVEMEKDAIKKGYNLKDTFFLGIVENRLFLEVSKELNEDVILLGFISDGIFYEEIKTDAFEIPQIDTVFRETKIGMIINVYKVPIEFEEVEEMEKEDNGLQE